MFGYYNINNLFIANMGRIFREDGECYIEHLDTFLIVKKISHSYYEKDEQFKEIFTNTKYRIPSRLFSNINEIVVNETVPITSFCNKKELLKGRITKKRLVEIYSDINEEILERELEEYSELQEKNKIKELMKKYDN